ncbi:MAG: biotin carboxylase N-terminal domain-containing protein, partial [Candidatus Berkiella sp.]
MNNIKTLLIANRGEIACRIIKTAKQLNIKTIAIYATPDSGALHCQLADEAYCVGEASVEKSYLNIQNILKVAKLAHADAIHPGYGFLSENATFAKECEKNGIIFVGPSSDAIRKMAVKDEAKAIMSKALVPCVPGYMGKDQSPETLLKEANKIGYPIMIKAAFGGGGKGMRVVHQEAQLRDAIESAKRESLSSFGNDALFLEKYLSQSRHIEVQIFRDSFGNCVHLFERDCSLQRRHQKIIEESPAIDIPDNIKQKLYSAAINAANAIDYLGAGTIEFLYTNDNHFYFMEMNTRL